MISFNMIIYYNVRFAHCVVRPVCLVFFRSPSLSLLSARMYADYGSRSLAQVAVEDREDPEDYEMYQTFADVINKKFNVNLMSKGTTDTDTDTEIVADEIWRITGTVDQQ